MKVSMIVAYVLIAVLAVIAFMQWRMIGKLTTPASVSSTDDGTAPFGDTLNALKKTMSNVEIKATYSK